MPTILYWTDDETGELDAVQFDVTTSEEPEDTATVTDHPVEVGADVSDHVRKDPERITAEGYITNTPHQGNVIPDEDDHTFSTVQIAPRVIGPGQTKTADLDVASPGLQPSLSSIVTTIGSAIAGATTATFTAPGDPRTASVGARGFSSPTNRNRVRIAYEKLLAAQAAPVLVTAVFESREYFDMIITRIAKPRATGDGSAHKFSVDLRKIRVAESQTVESPKPAEPRGAAPRDLGSQSAKEDPNADDKNAQRESFAHRIVN